MRKKNKAPEYVGFGYVDFPIYSGEYEDSKIGICTVRILAVDIYVNRKWPIGSDTYSFDDVFIGTDIHEKPEDGFNYLQETASSIAYSALIGHVNWVGSSSKEEGKFWTCGYNDLTKTGKQIYDSVKNNHIGCQILISTAACQNKETIKDLLVQTSANGLPKLSCLLV